MIGLNGQKSLLIIIFKNEILKIKKRGRGRGLKIFRKIYQDIQLDESKIKSALKNLCRDLERFEVNKTNRTAKNGHRTPRDA
jgi:hypothetical protein